MRLLIIEDEEKAAAYMRQGLIEAGFVVDVAHGGESGLRAARAFNHDLIVCDVMLPDQSGFSVVSELRRAGRQTPVLFVTARDDIESRVRGLDLGGDDYLIKPFAFAELVARIRALLRRTPSRTPDTYRVGELACNPRTRRVEHAGHRIDLTPKEYALLLFLLEHASEVVSRTLIAESVWDMHFDSDTNLIDVQVRRLRTKLEAAGVPPLIHTVRGVGYVLEHRADPQ